MKRYLRWIVSMLMISLLIGITINEAQGWPASGATFGPISRAEIIANAYEMKDFTWTPKNTITNGYNGLYKTFYAGTTYTGVAYCQQNPQENKNEFLSAVNNTSGGNTYYGSDCSGFASIAWKLPTRYGSSMFESDAINSGGYCYKLADIGYGIEIRDQLYPGDAFVDAVDTDGDGPDGRHVLIVNRILDTGQVESIDQTTWFPRTKTYSWSTELYKYRPIRRYSLLGGPSVDLEVFNNRLYAAYIEKNSSYASNVSTADGITWENWSVSSPTAFTPMLKGFNQRLYQWYVSTKTTNKLWDISSTRGIKWENWTDSIIPATGAYSMTDAPPSVVEYNGRLYQAYVGKHDRKIWVASTTDGLTWTNWWSSSELSSVTPKLAVYNGTLYLVLVDRMKTSQNQNTVLYATTNGINWVRKGYAGFTYESPDVVAFNGKLYLAYFSDSQRVWLLSGTDGANWPTSKKFEDAFTQRSPKLAVHNGALYLALVDSATNKIVFYSSTDGSNWTLRGSTGSTQETPDVLTFNNKLHAAYVDKTSGIPYVSFSTDGQTWTSQAINKLPFVTLAEPDGIDDTVNQSYNITWVDDDPTHAATISLYYDTDNTGQNGVLIASGLPENEDNKGGSYTWNTSAVPNGQYYIYAKLENGSTSAVDYSDGKITISHGGGSYALSIAKTGTGTGTVTSNPAGINCGSDCSQSYSSGSAITITATATTDSTFTGWTGGGCSGTGTCNVTMNADKTVTANFAKTITPEYLLEVTISGYGTVTSSPAGIDCGADCSQPYAAGTSVTLTATPASGRIFLGWSNGVCSGTGTCVIKMDQDQSIQASFLPSPGQPPQGNLSVIILGNGSVTRYPEGNSCGTNCSSYEVPMWEPLLLTPAPASGSVFVGWIGGGCTGVNTCGIFLDSFTPPITAIFSTPSVCSEKTVCNGDFENGLFGWQSVENVALTSGNYELGIEVRSDEKSDIFQPITGVFQAGKTYELTAWCLADVGEKCGLYLGDANTRANATPHENEIQRLVDGTGEWQQISVKLTLSHAEALDVYLYAPVFGSTVGYDDVQIQPISQSGDMDYNNQFNIFDLQRLINCIFGTGNCVNGDLNGDEKNNIFDVQQLVNKIFKS